MGLPVEAQVDDCPAGTERDSSEVGVYVVGMTRFRHSTSLAIALAACGGQTDPVLSVRPDSTAGVQFAIDLWPGEGIPVIEARRELLLLRDAPDANAPVVDSLRGRIGRRLAFDSTRYQTLRSGELRAVTPLSIAGRDLGELTHLSRDRYYSSAVDASIPVAVHGTIEFLQYRAEGTCFVRIDKRVIDAHPCPGFGKESVEVTREPLTEWWILVRGMRGTPGWLLVSDSTAQAVRREF
jgi:hypothetical protein